MKMKLPKLVVILLSLHLLGHLITSAQANGPQTLTPLTKSLKAKVSPTGRSSMARWTAMPWDFKKRSLGAKRVAKKITIPFAPGNDYPGYYLPIAAHEKARVPIQTKASNPIKAKTKRLKKLVKSKITQDKREIQRIMAFIKRHGRQFVGPATLKRLKELKARYRAKMAKRKPKAKVYARPKLIRERQLARKKNNVYRMPSHKSSVEDLDKEDVDMLAMEDYLENYRPL